MSEGDVLKSEGGQEYLLSKELDYKKKGYDTPVYKFLKVLPTSGGTSITIAAASNQDVTFEVPVKVVNMAQSYLSWQTAIDAQGAGNYTWVPQDVFGEIPQIQFFSRSGVYLVDSQYLANFMKVIPYREMPADSLRNRDPVNSLYTSDLPANQNYIPVSNGGSITATIPYREPQYLAVSGVNAVYTRANIQLRLGDILDSFFAVDKDVIFPEIMQVRVVFQNVKAGWLGTSNVNPTTGAAALTGNLTVSNLALYLAAETRHDIIQELTKKLASGYSIQFPYTWMFRNSLTGPSQTAQVRLGSNHGGYCKKVTHAVFSATESKNTALDHSNIGTTTATASKITSFYTQLDSVRQQEFDLTSNADSGLDYMHQKKLLQGSLILNKRMHYLHWCFQESWEGQPSASEQPLSTNFIGGLDLSTERKWDFVSSVLDSDGNGTYANLIHHTFVTCSRVMNITSNSITISPK